MEYNIYVFYDLPLYTVTLCNSVILCSGSRYFVRFEFVYRFWLSTIIISISIVSHLDFFWNSGLE